jgi:hypothetical protein
LLDARDGLVVLGYLCQRRLGPHHALEQLFERPEHVLLPRRQWVLRQQ